MKILITRFRTNGVGDYLHKELVGLGHEVDMLKGDIDDPDTYATVDLSQYDRVVNVAGLTLNEPVKQMDTYNSERVISVNLLGAMMITSKYAQQRGKDGAIFHVSSIGSRKVMTNCSVYSATKAGLSHYVSCAGWELKGDNIAVVSFNPANILHTNLTNDVQRGLRENRGMSQEQIDAIYKDALNPEVLAKYMVRTIGATQPEVMMISGESIFLTNSDHR